MDELESFFQIDMMDNNSNFQFMTTEDIQLLNKQQTPIETHQKVYQQQESHSQKSSRNLRVDNNIFKTPLSEFRKVMKHFLVQNQIQSEAFVMVNKERRNNSTFLKYWVLCEKMSIKEVIKARFKEKVGQNLQNKKGKMQKKRYDELKRVYERMLSSLECDGIENAVKIYWGRFRQKSKFLQSFEKIVRFQKFLETINQVKSVKQQSQKQQ